MHLIAPLSAGIIGAPNGTAEVYKRATGTRATWYQDFEASLPNSTGNDITLDGNGGAEVYVNEVVDVVVRNVGGSVVREFTAGSAAGSIEVISSSFTGADYETGISAAGEPLTLQAVMDLWKVSAGTTDFKVLVNGVATLLRNAYLAAIFFNVKDGQFGAKGDGTTDDTAAIQAAIDAARDAGGGIVYFPGGTYRTTSAMTWDRKVSLLGVGSTHSIITMDHATARIFVCSGATSSSHTFVSGLTFSHAQANTGIFFDMTVDARSHVFIDCVFGASANSRGLVMDDTGQHAVITLISCRFVTRAAMLIVDELKAFDCRFVPAAWSGAVATLITCPDVLLMSNCEFFPGDLTAGTITLISSSGYGAITGTVFHAFGATTTAICISQGATSTLSVTGCKFGLKGSATGVTAMAIATGAAFSEYGNSWEGAVAALLPDWVPYSYTTSVSGEVQQLGSRDGFRQAITQTGGGTQTLSGNLYGNFFVTITDNTAFVLNINLAPVGALVFAVLYSSGGAGTGAITWGANIYGTPTAGFTIATTKARLYTFKSMLVNAAHGWVIVGNIGYGGDI